MSSSYHTLQTDAENKMKPQYFHRQFHSNVTIQIVKCLTFTCENVQYFNFLETGALLTS